MVSFIQGDDYLDYIDSNKMYKRVYGQFCIETLHESRKQKSNGLFVRISTFT